MKMTTIGICYPGISEIKHQRDAREQFQQSSQPAVKSMANPWRRYILIRAYSLSQDTPGTTHKVSHTICGSGICQIDVTQVLEFLKRTISGCVVARRMKPRSPDLTTGEFRRIRLRTRPRHNKKRSRALNTLVRTTVTSDGTLCR